MRSVGPGRIPALRTSGGRDRPANRPAGARERRNPAQEAGFGVPLPGFEPGFPP